MPRGYWTWRKRSCSTQDFPTKPLIVYTRDCEPQKVMTWSKAYLDMHTNMIYRLGRLLDLCFCLPVIRKVEPFQRGASFIILGQRACTWAIMTRLLISSSSRSFLPCKDWQLVQAQTSVCAALVLSFLNSLSIVVLQLALQYLLDIPALFLGITR
jgi:hypothetical protein